MGHVHDLVVNSHLLSVVANNQDLEGTGTLSIRLLDLVDQVALVNTLQSLLNLAILGHGNESVVITDINKPVLLEDRTQEGMEDNGWRWVRDNTWLLVELLGEEVNTEVSVLTGLSGGGDTDDLAWTVLEDNQVTNADVVARDGEGGGLGGVGGGDGGSLLGLYSVRGGVGGVSIGILIVVFVLGHCFFGDGTGRSVKKFFVVGEELF